jgi:hypothetical protein
MITVTVHFVKYGPMGVPNGFVDAQNLGYGNTPCLSKRQLLSVTLVNIGTHLPHSRMTRDCPICTAIKLPNALRAISKLKAFTPLAWPKTLVKKRLATVTPDVLMSCLGTDFHVSIQLPSLDHINHTSCKVSNIREKVKHRYNDQRV